MKKRCLTLALTGGLLCCTSANAQLDLRSIELTALEVPEPVEQSFPVGDIDGDGFSELLILTTSEVFLLADFDTIPTADADGGFAASVVWQSPRADFACNGVMGSNIVSAFAVGDYDGGGRPDFAFNCTDGTAVCPGESFDTNRDPGTGLWTVTGPLIQLDDTSPLVQGRAAGDVLAGGGTEVAITNGGVVQLANNQVPIPLQSAKALITLSGTELPVALGDINGDGFDDLFQPEPAATTDFTQPGAVITFGGLPLQSISVNVNNAAAEAVVPIGDFNGDDVNDIAIRVAAGSWLIYRGIVTPGTDLNAYFANPPTGAQAGQFSFAGFDANQVFALGDLNADGLDDVLATGAPSRIIFGNASFEILRQGAGQVLPTPLAGGVELASLFTINGSSLTQPPLFPLGKDIDGDTGADFSWPVLITTTMPPGELAVSIAQGSQIPAGNQRFVSIGFGPSYAAGDPPPAPDGLLPGRDIRSNGNGTQRAGMERGDTTRVPFRPSGFLTDDVSPDRTFQIQSLDTPPVAFNIIDEQCCGPDSYVDIQPVLPLTSINATEIINYTVTVSETIGPDTFSAPARRFGFQYPPQNVPPTINLTQPGPIQLDVADLTPSLVLVSSVDPIETDQTASYEITDIQPAGLLNFVGPTGPITTADQLLDFEILGGSGTVDVTITATDSYDITLGTGITNTSTAVVQIELVGQGILNVAATPPTPNEDEDVTINFEPTGFTAPPGLTVTFTDPGGAPIADFVVAQQTCCAGPSSIVVTPALNFAGDVDVNLTLTNGAETASATVPLSFAQVTDPPVLTLQPVLPIEVDGPGSVVIDPVVGIDPIEPAQTVSYEVAYTQASEIVVIPALPPVLQENDPVTIDYTGRLGSVTLDITASDSGGDSSTEQITVEFVQAPNDRQVDVPASPLAAVQGGVVTVEHTIGGFFGTPALEPVTFFDAATERTIDFPVVASSVNDAGTAGTITFNVPADAPAQVFATIRYSEVDPNPDVDTRLFSTGGDFSLLIEQVPRSVQIAGSTPSPALEDNPFTVGFVADGFLMGAQLRNVLFESGGQVVNGFTVSGAQCCEGPSSFVVTPPADFSGPVVVTVVVEELQTGISADASTAVTIIDVNDRPIIGLGDAIDPIDVEGEQVVVVTPVASLDAVEPGQTVQYTAAIAEQSQAIATLNSVGPFSAGESIELTLSGEGGEVVIEIVAMDDGGVANGGVDQSADEYRFVVNQVPTTVEVGGNPRPSAGGGEEIVTFTITNTGDAQASSVEAVVTGSGFEVSGGRTALIDCQTVIGPDGQVSVVCSAVDPATDWNCSEPVDGAVTCTLASSLPAGASVDLIVSGQTVQPGSVTASVTASNVSEPQIITVATGG